MTTRPHLPNIAGLDASAAALTYAEAGIPVVPFDPTKGSGKSCGNLVGDGVEPWYRKVTTDLARLQRWIDQFGPFQALATSPGEIGCLVIDLDKPQLWPKDWRHYLQDRSVPYVSTRPQEDKRRGHFWFTLASNEVTPQGLPSPRAARIGNPEFAWGDVRCVGGGIVLPPYTDRSVVRSGPIPDLASELADVFRERSVSLAGAGGGLDTFIDKYSQGTKSQRKLKGLKGLHRHRLAATGSRHKAMQTALLTGFGEARIGYVSAADVINTLYPLWCKSHKEFYSLASWCATVVEEINSGDLKLQSDRLPGTDTRKSRLNISTYYRRHYSDV